MKLKAAFALAAFAAAFCIFGVPTASSFAQSRPADTAAISQADMAMKQLTHAVQLGLERYKLDFGVCPDSLQALLNEGYLTEMPDNPYASLWSQSPAKCIEEDLSFRPTPGAIVYHPYTLDGDSLGGYILLGTGMKDSDTSAVSAHDLFYGEPRWDSMKYFMPDGKGDGRPERYVIMLSSPSLAPEMVVTVTHDAAWLSAQPDYRAKKALHALQLAAERYSVDDEKGAYPRDIQTLVKEGYIYMPLNPYYGVVPGATMRIEVCAPGEFKPGGIVYIPFTMPDRSGAELVGYQIGIYGGEPDGGIDAGAVIDGEWRFYPFLEKPTNPDGVPDGFIVVLGSGPSPGQSAPSPGGT